MPFDYDQFREARRFASLDGVRGIAAVAVVMFHFGGPSFAWASGWLGVHVFFVLSGFIITTLALREEERNGRISLRNFYVRRIFRIWPAYLFVLALLVALFVARGEFASREVAETLPWYLTFNSDLHLGDIFYGHTWTIAIEQRFYLVWPLLAFLPWIPAVRRHRLGLLAAIFLVGAALWGVVGHYAVHYLVIAVGCLVAVLMHDRRTFPGVAALARPLPAALCWAAFAVYHLAVPSLVRAAGGEPLVIMGYGVMVGLILPSLVALPALTRVFGGRVMRWWGERSYSLYLVQQVAGWALATLVPVFGTPRLLSAVAVVLCSAVMADLVHRWVEQPGIELGRRFVSRPGRRRSPVVPPAMAPATPPVAPQADVPATFAGGALPSPRAVGARPVGAHRG
ncbi:acyltransferase family protein [Blastococcus haudaquaticus]|uniref:acyltransferase family protein n=1 Tax=Blastococcus haudaquaticus TaxID=1938745 RepID=UPI000BE2834E|nr:acyltransferase [Blastococcus haudaquaticus]